MTPDNPTLRRQFELEAKLAAKLRRATREERRGLYSQVYDELYAAFPHLAAEARAAGPEKTAWSLGWLKHFLKQDGVFVELGAGDCGLSYAAAPLVRKAIALDVSAVFTGSSGRTAPPNFELRVYDGFELPLADASVDIVFSTQLMEHLHPADAAAQLADVRRVLKPGGAYLCITPHRFNGPHDVSRHFGREARGLHLKEYTNHELGRLFRTAGFSRVACLVGGRGRVWRLPLWSVSAGERLLGCLPYAIRHALASAFPWRNLLGICLLGTR